MKSLGLGEAEAREPISFKEFLALISSQNQAEMDGHWRPQHMHLTSFGISYDMVGCFERFDGDFLEIVSVISKEILKYKTNVDEHKTRAAGMHHLYDKDSLEMVQKIYREDFEMLGYSQNISMIEKPSSRQIFDGFKVI